MSGVVCVFFFFVKSIWKNKSLLKLMLEEEKKTLQNILSWSHLRGNKGTKSWTHNVFKEH